MGMADEWRVRKLVLEADIVATEAPSMIRWVETVFKGQYAPDERVVHNADMI